MRVDATGFAKIVFGCVRAPCVEAQVFGPFQNLEGGRNRRHRSRPPTLAERAITSCSRGQASGKFSRHLDSATMA